MPTRPNRQNRRNRRAASVADMMGEARESASRETMPRPLTDQEIAHHNSLVQQRKRADVVIPDPLPKAITDNERAAFFVVARQIVAFTIDELEATDAVEQFIEEMAIEKISWLTALLKIAEARRKWYKEEFPAIPTPDQSRAAMLRRDPNFPLHRRVLEVCELGRIFEEQQLLSNAELEDKFPLMATNRLYWGLRTMDDVERIFRNEVDYLLSIPGIFERVYEMIPWFQERGWFGEPGILLFLLNTMRFKDPFYSQVIDKVKDDGYAYFATRNNSWAEPRKPGVVLRDRPHLLRQ